MMMVFETGNKLPLLDKYTRYAVRSGRALYSRAGQLKWIPPDDLSLQYALQFLWSLFFIKSKFLVESEEVEMH